MGSPIFAGAAAAAAAGTVRTRGMSECIEGSAIEEAAMLEAKRVFTMSIPYALVKVDGYPGKEIMAIDEIPGTEPREAGFFIFRRRTVNVPVTKEVLTPINEAIKKRLPAGAVVRSFTVDWFHKEVDVVYTVD